MEASLTTSLNKSNRPVTVTKTLLSTGLIDNKFQLDYEKAPAARSFEQLLKLILNLIL
ncbi:hypothetical protein AAMO2058_000535200 [Amorphochlora amoebiformis]